MSTLSTNAIIPVTGTTITLGESGDTISIPSGATISNSGTATNFGGGKVKQCVQTLYTTQTSSSAGSFDMRRTSIPTNSDGAEVFTVSITPTASDSTLLVYVLCKVAPGGDGNRMCIMLFQDSVSNALEMATEMAQSGGDMINLAMNYKKTSGTTSSTTFKVRMAPHTGETMYINRGNSDAIGGGIMTSSIVVWEIGA